MFGTRKKRNVCGNVLILFTAALVCVSNASSAETTSGPSMQEIVSGVQKLCGGSGSGVDLQISGSGAISASKTVSLLVNGKATGSATFTKSEWDGIRAMRDDPRNYVDCVKSLTPLFIDKFTKKAAETPLYTIVLKEWDLVIPRGDAVPGYRISQVRLLINDGNPIELKPAGISEQVFGFKYSGTNLRLASGDYSAKFEIDYNVSSDDPNQRSWSNTIFCSAVLKVRDSIELRPIVEVANESSRLRVRTCRLS